MAAGWSAWDGGGAGELRLGAAGAGVGFLIGFVTGLATAGTGWSPEPATSPACPEALVKSTAPAEDNTKPERTR
jgi:hypothetical protein